MTVEIKPSTNFPRIEALRQLCRGPIWDGDLISKADRKALVDCGYACQCEGWNLLTPEGCRVAVNLKLVEEGLKAYTHLANANSTRPLISCGPGEALQEPKEF